MKVIQINCVYKKGSTGKICYSISKLLTANGIENLTIYSHGKNDTDHAVKLMPTIYFKFQTLFSRIFGNYGFNAYLSTLKTIRIIDKFKPDAVHLHNIHGNDFNLTMLFDYFRKHKEIKLFWTFHDTWAFTAYCPFFDVVKCDKWKTECHNCPKTKHVTWLFDRSRYLFNLKKQVTQGLNLTIVTPSKWLEALVKQSFLKNYPCLVINNGIDLCVFKPTDNNFREEYHIPANKKILLLVTASVCYGKGIDIFAELAKRMDTEKYQFVLVGGNEKKDKGLPDNIISIHATKSQQKLAEIYSAADLFVNTTREDNFPTVNMEAIACGTPVITFRTGGCPEMVTDKTGMVIERGDIDAMQRGIEEICENNLFSRETCVKIGHEFDANKRFLEYMELYTK